MILRSLLIAGLAGAVCQAHAQVQTNLPDSSVKIRDIRSVFQQIEKDSGLNKVTLNQEEFLGDEAPDNGGSLRGYFRGDTLCKASTWIGLSYAVIQEHFYYSNGQLIFVFETEDDFAQKAGGLDPSKLVRSFEARYYFEKDNVLRVLTKGKRKMDADDPHHYLELYHNAHYYAGLLVKKHRIQKPVSPATVPARTT
jgi:hypothetical protein